MLIFISSLLFKFRELLTTGNLTYKNIGNFYSYTDSWKLEVHLCSIMMCL